MAKFCTRCGKPLEEGKMCACRNTSLWKKFKTGTLAFTDRLAERMGVDLSGGHALDPFERDRSVVPDCLIPNDDECSVREYKHVAILRSRILFKRSEGRLCVTNKRLVFRASGISLTGPIVLQHEFALPEIAGLEIKKSNRISPLNIFLSILSSLLIIGLFGDVFQAFAQNSHTLASLISVLLGIATALPFFLLNKKFWIKLFVLSCGIGALTGTGELTNATLGSLISGVDTNFSDYFTVILSVLWLLNIVLVSLVPDLMLCVKTKGAAEAFQIRRKQPATLFKQEVEYTGFSEVVPAKDIDLIISEVGAIIDDIQTLGDLAIDKWKEK